MKKIKVGIIATLAGLLIVAAATAFLLGIIYSVTYDATYILLILAPVVVWGLVRRMIGLCDKINSFEG